MNTDASDAKVERLVAHLVAETRRLLTEHQALLLELALALAAQGKLESAHIAELAQRHGLSVAVCDENYMAVADYAQCLNSVVEQQGNCS
jgi:cell division protease FtsH